MVSRRAFVPHTNHHFDPITRSSSSGDPIAGHTLSADGPAAEAAPGFRLPPDRRSEKVTKLLRPIYDHFRAGHFQPESRHVPVPKPDKSGQSITQTHSDRTSRSAVSYNVAYVIITCERGRNGLPLSLIIGSPFSFSVRRRNVRTQEIDGSIASSEAWWMTTSFRARYLSPDMRLDGWNYSVECSHDQPLVLLRGFSPCEIIN